MDSIKELHHKKSTLKKSKSDQKNRYKQLIIKNNANYINSMIFK